MLDQLTPSVHRIQMPVLMYVECANCRSLNEWMVQADYGLSMLGQMVAFACECGPGQSVGFVRRLAGLGEAGRG